MGLSLRKLAKEGWRNFNPVGAAWNQWGNDVENFFGKEDRRNARHEAARADTAMEQAREMQERQLAISEERFGLEKELLNEERNRWDQYYAPMEKQLVDDVAGGPDLEGEASLARNRYGNEFDQSMDARRRNEARYGIQPGSAQAARREDSDVYNRARGLAQSANTARREEDDRHFFKTEALFRQNGSGIKSRLLSGIGNTYGAEAGAYGTAGNQAIGFGQYHQGNSDRYAQQSMAGWNLAGDIVGQGVQAYGMAAGSPQVGVPQVGVPATPRQAIPTAAGTGPGVGGVPATPRQAIPTAASFDSRLQDGSAMSSYRQSQPNAIRVGNATQGNVPGANRAAINYQES